MILKEKIAIVTGSGQGIGRELALGLSREGAKVVVVDIHRENAEKVAAEIRKNGGEALAVRTDVSSESEVAAMVKTVIDAFGRIDILLNNAAVYFGLPLQPFTQWTVEEWDRIFSVNVRGAWLCMKSVVPHMANQGKGKILNISSVSFHLGFAYFLPYVASKGAVISMTRALARELGDQGINVNSIAPGFTMSEASQKLAAETAGMTESVVGMQCIKRSEVPKDLVGAAVFFVSEHADFITGQTLLVDGGLVMH